MKTQGRMRRLAASLALTLAMSAAAAGTRDVTAEPSEPHDDSRWFAFMPQHHIDRQALKVRRDGLVESASRYPRTSGAGWTAEQDAQGRHELLERLIDCETGLYVDVALVLLGRDGKPVARQPLGLDEQLQQIALRQADVLMHEWPKRSEIGLACALARWPAARDMEELRSAAQGALDRDTVFDLHALDEAPPPDGRGLFSRLQAQYDAYRARFAPARATRPMRRAAAVAQPGERWLELQEGYGTTRFDLASMRHVDGRLEIVGEARGHVARWPSGLDQEQTDVRNTIAIDCRIGLTLPVEQLFYAKGGSELLHRRSVPVFTTWQSLAHSGVAGWDEWLGPQEDAASAQLCRMAAARCLGTQAEAATVFEIDPATLPDEGGVPLVLAAREVWARHRAGFVPACAIGDR